MNTSFQLHCESPQTPLSTLAAVADAPVIVCLFGDKNITIAWDDDPFMSVLKDNTLPKTTNRQSLIEDSWGKTWGLPPANSIFAQLDYEWPHTAARLLQPRFMAQWNFESPNQTEAFKVTAPSEALAQSSLKRIQSTNKPLPSLTFTRDLAPLWTAEQHAFHVQRIRDWIAQGDCYQANLAVPFSAKLQAHAANDVSLFHQLLKSSPAPFAGFFRSPHRPSVISHSPECFVCQRADKVVSVPIKGTRRRIAGQEDATRRALASASKDAAELAMIVDLVRNDLGHVAQPGSVSVADRGHFIDLTYVHHRAARIEAQLQKDKYFSDVVTAAFPAGSITGAPKLRAMQILAELEGGPRGAYCGAFGWIGQTNADLAVAIRTASLQGDDLTFHAGGGIVWDSEATAEWDEVHAKAAGFGQAIGAISVTGVNS